jgi:(4-(4-[2-(gamma-L-glutamylamino)ethyl]phenoxymethyl)furan-2-yl)methanamine synthase
LIAVLKWLGIDIGGANIKIADCTDFASSVAFPLWKFPDQLGQAIGEILRIAPEFHCLAVTMTGELADCYETREEGVCRILEQLTSVVPAPLVRIYGVDGTWYTVSHAARLPWQVAASNWHALAQYCLPFADGEPALLVDVGSTTTDIIPLDKKVCTDAVTDSQRMIARQLVYAGVERTPVCSLVKTLPLYESECPVMAEVFATTADVYTWLCFRPETQESSNTSDGRPDTRRGAKFRLARMVGEDGSTISDADVERMAESIADAHAHLIAQSMLVHREQFKKPTIQRVITSGHGDFVVDAALRQLRWSPKRVRLIEELGEEVSRCAPARAVACLAEMQLSTEFSHAERAFEAGS